MAHTLYLDHTSNLSMVEHLGAIRSLIRKARVNIDPALATDQNYTSLEAALSVCPAAMSTLDDAKYQSLVLVGREPSVAENDPLWVDVMLKYEHLLDGPHQQLAQPARGMLFGKGRTSISEKTTNFYYPNGDITQPKTQILVGHTYAPHEAHRVVSAYPGYPNLVIQGGEVTIPFPQSNFNLEGVLTVRNPWSIAQKFIAAINGVTWMGYAPGYWICSEVQWECLDTETLLYKFLFEFQYNVDTWNPTVVFEDQQMGRPPAAVLPATLKDHAYETEIVIIFGTPTTVYVPDPNGVKCLVRYPYAVPTQGAQGGAGEPGPDLLNGGVLQNIPDTLAGVIPNFPVGIDHPETVIPAGLWQVPALRSVSFDQMFQSYFEGENVIGLL